jgi:peptidylprolyl isomerase
MRCLARALATVIAALLISSAANSQDMENMLYMDLEHGRVVIELRPDLAPKHVARIKELAREGFYDGIVFHRVIPGFMAQTGDPTGTGRGGSDKPDLPAEFSNEPFVRGTVGMARTSDPNSANSQFFINFVATPHLNGQYTVWGQVVEGMEHIDAIAQGEPPTDPDKIVKMQVASDAEQ